MPETERTSLMIRPDQKDVLEEMAESDNPRWDNQSEACRHWLDEARRIDELEDEIEDLNREIESLRNEKRVLIGERRDQKQQQTSDETGIVPVDDDDRGIVGRLSWLLREK